MDNELNSLDVSTDESISTEAPAESAPAPQEYAFKAHGKEVKAPIEKVLQWASMGYEYPQKAAELNRQQQDFQRRQEEFKAQEQKWTPYKEVDEYAAQNQEWWQHVQEQYKQKLQGAQSNPEVQALKQELAELKAFRDELKTEKQSQKIQEEDTKLSQEVESIRKSYPNIDFDSPDETGLTLEMKILSHAQENNLPTFRAAFRDYYHDHLIGKAKEEGKELVAKDKQKLTKLGVLSETKQPTKGLRPAQNVRDKSYDDLLQEGLKEAGLA